ncbi:MAG: chemotaxis protein CheC [Candidatus Desantisbacteria bacterium]
MQNLNLNKEQLDALREIGNIGGGNAATALSQFLDRRVSVTVPQATLLSLDDFSGYEFMMKPEELSIAVSLRILGKLKGGMLVLFSQRDALLMIDILMQRKMGSTEIFTTIDESALSESTHIICCSYLNAIGEFLKLYQLIPSITQTALDRVDKLSKVLIKRFVGGDIGYVLPIQNHLIVEDIEVNLYVIFLLEPESQIKILEMIGL